MIEISEIMVRRQTSTVPEHTGAWFQHKCGHQSCNTPCKVNRPTTRYIHHPHLIKKSTMIPHPVSRKNVRYEVDERVQNVPPEVRSFRHCTGHDCGGCGGEGQLEEVPGEYVPVPVKS